MLSVDYAAVRTTEVNGLYIGVQAVLSLYAQAAGAPGILQTKVQRIVIILLNCESITSNSNTSRK